MLFKHILIVGVGLIGGSFGLAARRAGLANRITGYGKSRSLQTAISMGVIDDIEDTIDQGARCEADLIYLAAPVGGIIDFIVNRGSLVKPGAIVTDAGSTKREICRAARESLTPEASFVGGHPMAGSHKTGVEHASADLFSGAPYVIVAQEPYATSNQPDSGAAGIVEEAVRAIGGNPVYMTAETHDHEVARLSHTPQMLSIALANAAGNHSAGAAPRLAGKGLRDMTRLAASRWSVWKDICETNQDEIISALDELAGEIESIRGALVDGRYSWLGQAFDGANRFASHLAEKDEGLQD